MTIKLKEIQLTAYALGELEEPERSQLEAELHHDTDAQAFIEEVRQTAGLVADELMKESGPGLTDIHRLAIANQLNNEIEFETSPSGNSHNKFFRRKRFSLAAATFAATLFIVGGLAGIMFATYQRAVDVLHGDDSKIAKTEDHPVIDTDIEYIVLPRRRIPVAIAPHNPTQPDGPLYDNPYVVVSNNPLSKFPITVGTTSHIEVKRFLNRGELPPREFVRIEELINVFDYDYIAPEDEGASFAAHTEVNQCPWNPNHRLARIGLKGSDLAPLDDKVIARNVKIQVEFNPAKVAAFRLIGFENRPRASVAGAYKSNEENEVDTGHEMTAVYEIVPTDQAHMLELMSPIDQLRYQTPNRLTKVADSFELMNVKLRYQPADRPGSTESAMLQFPVEDDEDFGGAPEATPDFKFTAAVASFGMILRDSPFKGTSSFEGVMDMAEKSIRNSKAVNPKRDYSLRQEFQAMVEKANSLKKPKR